MSDETEQAPLAQTFDYGNSVQFRVPGRLMHETPELVVVSVRRDMAAALADELKRVLAASEVVE